LGAEIYLKPDVEPIDKFFERSTNKSFNDYMDGELVSFEKIKEQTLKIKKSRYMGAMMEMNHMRNLPSVRRSEHQSIL
jgi:hypothetical protein